MIEEQIIKGLETNEIKKKRITLIHKVFLSQLKTNRKYTASTKTKAEVRGGGRKPWRQKGTGQARAGSTRSPLWVGGGVTFGPRKGRIVYKKINHKEKKLAIIAALYLKEKQTKLLEVDILENSKSFKTKDITNLLKSLEISKEEKTLIILPKPNNIVWLASRNLTNVEVSLATCLNLKQILNSTKILLSTESAQIINETYGRKRKRKTD